MAPLTLPEYVAIWKRSTLTERSAAQQHFLGLCDLLGQPYPAQEDQTGETYTFEKGATKVEGGEVRSHIANGETAPALNVTSVP